MITPEQAAEYFERMSEGETVEQIAESDGYPVSVLSIWLSDYAAQGFEAGREYREAV